MPGWDITGLIEAGFYRPNRTEYRTDQSREEQNITRQDGRAKTGLGGEGHTRTEQSILYQKRAEISYIE